jgi:uncharacterized coiled-coil protein SlyX
MDTKIALERHEEQVKTLFKRTESMEKKIEKIENDRDFIHNLDKSMALQTQLIQSINAKMDEQHEINIKVNENLTKLSEQYNALNVKVDKIGNDQKKLAKKVEENEDKHNIDLRDVDRERNKGILVKYGAPFGVGIAIGMLILEIVKVLR